MPRTDKADLIEQMLATERQRKVDEGATDPALLTRPEGSQAIVSATNRSSSLPAVPGPQEGDDLQRCVICGTMKHIPTGTVCARCLTVQPLPSADARAEGPTTEGTPASKTNALVEQWRAEDAVASNSEYQRGDYLADVPPAAPGAEDATTWTCFHCGEVFTDKAEAREHFGADEWKTPACRLSADDVTRLRTLEAANAELRLENERLENDAQLWYESEADRVRRIGHVQWWQEMDSREGEKLVLLERIKELEARAASPAPAPNNVLAVKLAELLAAHRDFDSREPCEQCDTLDAAITALSGRAPAPAAGSAWQPIATAPKGSWLDGPERIDHPDYVPPPSLWLLLGSGQRCVGAADAYYADGGGGFDGGSYWVEQFSGERVTPTHWMPLPSAGVVPSDNTTKTTI